MYTACWTRTGPAAILLYRSIQWEHEHSDVGRVFTVGWWIIIMVIPKRTPSVQGAISSQNAYTECGRRTGPAAMEFTALHSGCKSPVGGRVFTAQGCIAMRLVPSRTPVVQSATRIPRMCTLSM